MTDFDTDRLVRLRCLRKARKRAKDVFDHLDERFKQEVVEVHGLLTDAEIDKIGAGGTNFSPYEDTPIYIADEEEFEEWARRDAPELLQPHLSPRKAQLNQEVRRREDDGLPLPPGVARGQPRPKISMTKG